MALEDEIAALNARVANLEGRAQLPTELTDKLTSLVGRKNLTQVEIDNWRGGAANGGPAGDGLYPMTDSSGFVRKVPSPAKVAEIAAGSVTPRYTGAAPGLIRDWRSETITPNMFPDVDHAFSIQRAIDAAWESGASSVFIPNDRPVRVLEFRGDVPGDANHTEDKVRGIIKLRPGVSILSNGAKLMIAPGDEVAMGRDGPPGMFYQNMYENFRCDDVRISGLVMDGNIEHQTWAVGDGAEGNGSLAWQYTHAIALLRGDNFTIDNCRFRGWRGDGAVIGNAFTENFPTFVCRNAHVRDCEFKDIYREGVLFADVDGGSFVRNFVHGNGYLVAGVDIERHQKFETVRGIEVAGNKFDFTDGDAPWERNGPTIPRYRRGVSIGFFYKAFGTGPDGKPLPPDGLSGAHSIHHNKFYQGGIDSWRHTDVDISNNYFQSYYEDLTGVRLIQPHAIQIMDFNGTPRLEGIRVCDNIIDSNMAGNGIFLFNYSRVTVTGNQIKNTRLPGIRANFCSGIIGHNTVEDACTMGARDAGIVIDGSQAGGISAFGNRARNNTAGDARTLNACIRLVGAFSAAPMVFGNGDSNLYNPAGQPPAKTVINDAQDKSFALIFGNGGGTTFGTNRNLQAGDGTATDAVQVRVTGGALSARTMEFMTGEVQRASMGLTGGEESDDNSGSNFSAFMRDNNGGYHKNILKVERKTGNKDLSDGSVRMSGSWPEPLILGPDFTRFWVFEGKIWWNYNAPTGPMDGQTVNFTMPQGTWEQPYIMAGVYIWYNPDTGLLMRNFAAPTSATDGRAIGPQPGGTWDFPLSIGGMWMWANPDNGKLYIKGGAAPTGPTDGTVVGAQS